MAALRVRRENGTPRRRRRVRKRRLAALLCVLLVLAALSFTFGLVRAVASEIPSLDPAAQRSDVDSVVYASNGRSVLAVLRGSESRVLVESEEIAPIMRQAIVSAEDQRFFEHNGIDLTGVARALWQDVRNQGIVEGGSTITQQFVKNAYIRNEQTIARKVREAALAWQLEQKWPKDEDPYGVPEHDLLRERGVRDPAGLARLLQQEREGARAARSRPARRHPGGPDALRPRDEPTKRDGTAAGTCSG